MPNPWTTGTRIADQFIIERIIGSGGHGQVALATNLRTGERYAVKRIHRPNPLEQGRFIAEIKRWMAMPEHPHVVTCLFIRNLGDELVVFSEYMPAGSLAGRIRDREIYHDTDGGLQATMTIAAQLAWGLDAAHRSGILHLDVKPANVVFDVNGLAKITDFGLAAESAHRIGPRGSWSDNPSSVLATPAGHTVAYASPEQAEGRRVSRAADVWSWAVTVLEMVLGERIWISGTVAGAVLDAVLDGRIARRGIDLPQALGDILRSCLMVDPGERPGSMRDVGDQVAASLPSAASGLLEAPPVPVPVAPDILTRTSGEGVQWQDPQAIIDLAHRIAGRPDSPTHASYRGDRRAGIIADLQAFDEARQILTDPMCPVTTDRQHALAMVHANIASIRVGLGDEGGAVPDLARAISLLEGIDSTESRWYLTAIWMFLAEVLQATGRIEEALSACNRAVVAAELVGDPIAAAVDRGRALLTRAHLVGLAAPTTRQRRSLFRLCAKAIAAFQQAGDREAEARTLSLLAGAMFRCGHPERASDMWDSADAALLALSPDPVAEISRATLLLNRAAMVTDPAEAIRHAVAATGIYRSLIVRYGRFDRGARLGRALLLVGQRYEQQAALFQALSACREARDQLEYAALRGGQPDAAGWLVECYRCESRVARGLARHTEAVELAAQGTELARRIAEFDKRGMPRLSAVDAHRDLAAALVAAGDPNAAIEQLDLAAADLSSASQVDPARARQAQARLLIERSRIKFDGGDLAGSYHDLYTVTSSLESSNDLDDVDTRTRSMQTMAALLSTTGKHAGAVSAVRATVDDVRRLVRASRWPQQELAETHQRLTNLLLRYGDPAEAVTAGHLALAEYRQMRPEERDRLAIEEGKTGAAVGVALVRLADLPGAIAVLRPLASSLAGVDGSNLGQQITQLMGQLDGLVGEPADTVDSFAGLARARLQFAEDLVAASRIEEASTLLDDLHGMALWIVSVRPHDDEARCLHAVVARQLGITALRCGRDAAARRGYHHALTSYRIVVTECLRTSYADDWLDTHLLSASLLAADRDLAGVSSVLDELRDNAARWTPETAQVWRERADRLLALARDAAEQ